MSDTVPSPFRRFPWVQLVFCLACLSMAGWTWMRYSYAWDVTPRDSWISEPSSWFPPGEWLLDGRGLSPNPTLVGRYVGASGGYRQCTGYTGMDFLADHNDPGIVVYVTVPGSSTLAPDGTGMLVRGRVEVEKDALGVDPTRSRFTGVSVAGLVVGAMGVFIFGLYLRRWLIERKALAGQPGQDMIA
ncbi:MAG: hypothetical protein ACYS9X_06115 [Planctomycetota bacterium]